MAVLILIALYLYPYRNTLNIKTLGKLGINLEIGRQVWRGLHIILDKQIN